MNVTGGLAVFNTEAGSQAGMTIDESLKDTLQFSHIKVAVNSHGHRDVVSRAVRVELVQKPQSPLPVRQTPSLPRFFIRPGCGAGDAVLCGGYLLRELANSQVLKEVVNWQPHAEIGLYCVHKLDC